MKIPSLQELIEDHKALEAFIYTPRTEAIEELNRRKKDAEVDVAVSGLLQGDIPSPLKKGPRAVLFRQIATPNHEMLRFLDITNPFHPVKPLFWEYYSDKFTNHNEFKHSLGKMRFFNGKGKKGGVKIDRVNVIDFNEYNGKKMSEIRTLWGQDFIAFHHDLFKKADTNFGEKIFYDASNWFSTHGKTASSYYVPFLSLFIKHGVLFENFLTNEKEGAFTKDIFLPAFLEVYAKTGLKPLIVALEPISSEEDEFWICYPQGSKKYLESKMAVEMV